MKRFKNKETGASVEPQSAFVESVLAENKTYICLDAEKMVKEIARAKPEKPKEE